jgi:hypothetical protein
MDRITYFARTNARNDRRVFGIKERDRLSHIYIIGKTGTGKSTLLERLILSDVEAAEGLALVDPHGDLAERIATRVPTHRRSDLVYLNVPDRSQPYAYNPLKRVTPERRPLAGCFFGLAAPQVRQSSATPASRVHPGIRRSAHCQISGIRKMSWRTFGDPCFTKALRQDSNSFRRS